jgi:hypothetical protein
MGDGLLASTVVTAVAQLAFPPMAGAVVYADRTTRGPGSVTCGSRTVQCDGSLVIVFRDEQPGANWMHACSYALVDPDQMTVRQQWPDDRPPTFGPLPETWIVASDPDQLADLIDTD